MFQILHISIQFIYYSDEVTDTKLIKKKTKTTNEQTKKSFLIYVYNQN